MVTVYVVIIVILFTIGRCVESRDAVADRNICTAVTRMFIVMLFECLYIFAIKMSCKYIRSFCINYLYI